MRVSNAVFPMLHTVLGSAIVSVMYSREYTLSSFSSSLFSENIISFNTFQFRNVQVSNSFYSMRYFQSGLKELGELAFYDC